MKKRRRSNSSRSKENTVESNTQIRKDSQDYKESKDNKDIPVYSYSFLTHRGSQEFRYYYIRKRETVERERKPGRIFKFMQQKALHPQRRGVTHQKGEISIFDDCSFNALKISQVTANIFVGGYPKTAKDLELLKKSNISAILSIQSDQDFKNHGISPHYFELLCEEHSIRFRRHAIEDMDSADFINKAEGGATLLSDLLKEGGKVYVHCSAGIYRSPQMIALYLTLFEHYPLE